MINAMKRIGLKPFSNNARRRRHHERSEAIQQPGRTRGLLRRCAPRNDGLQTCARHSASFITDRRGAVAFETLLVYLFIVTSLLLPLADVAAAGFQFISGWAALRAFGQLIQYKAPADPTNITTWKSTLPATVSGFPINNVQVLCGDSQAACSSANISSPVKYFSYATTVTLAPMVLSSILCTSGNANSCSFTLPYSERFQ